MIKTILGYLFVALVVGIFLAVVYRKLIHPRLPVRTQLTLERTKERVIRFFKERI